MKILVLIHEFPPVGGGGGRVAQEISRGIVKRGHEVTILTASFKDLPKEELVDGIRVLRISSFRREAFRADLLAMEGYVLSGLWAGYRFIKRWQPDLIHVHFAVPAGALAWSLSKVTGVPYVMTVHLGDVPGGAPEKTGGWFKWVLPFTHPIWRAAKQVIAVSEYTRQLALKHYKREIDVIPNGVDLALLRPASIQVQEPPRIVFAGRLMEQKNPLQIVRTLAELKGLPWQCVLIGDGPLMPEVRRAIAEHKLEHRFSLTGWVSPEQVLDWFDQSDILFTPSFSEGMPVVGVQALAKGLAIVASKIGGFTGIVDDEENGYLVDLASPSEFSVAIRKLISDNALLQRFRDASLKKASRFDSLQIEERYEQMFLQVSASDRAVALTR